MEYWKYRAIDKLKDYNAQKVSLENLTDEIARLKSEAYSIKSATAEGTAVKGGGSGREERMLSNIANRWECAEMLRRAKLSVRMVDRGLAALTDEDRHLLDTVYIIGEKGCIPRLMEEFGLQEESSLYKRIHKAIKRFTIAMYGGTEN